MDINRYESVYATSVRWGCTMRRVRQLCAAERVKGAVRSPIFRRGDWLIPKDSPKPERLERVP